MQKLKIGTDLFLLVSLLVLFIASGCQTQTLAEKCATAFPSTHSTEVRTVNLTDTIITPYLQTEYVDTTICPPGLVASDTIIKTRVITIPSDTIYREYTCTDTVIVSRDGPLIQRLTGEKQAAQLRIKSLEGKVYGRTVFTVLASVLALASLIFAFFRK